jgi:hypothetical protein
MYGMNRILTDIGWAAVAWMDLFRPMLYGVSGITYWLSLRISSAGTYCTHRSDIIHEGAGMRPIMRTQNMQNTYVVLEK